MPVVPLDVFELNDQRTRVRIYAGNLPVSGGPMEHQRRVQQAADERAAQRDSELASQASPISRQLR